MGATLVVCDTCRYSGEERECDGRTGGEIFYQHVRAAAADAPGIAVRRFACLMGCSHHCNVALMAPGKLGYVLGSFAPSPEAAAALVAYARHFAASETGQVPFRDWPQGVKGHFVARLPAPAMLPDDES